MGDPYDILGVKRGASFEEVKAAYRRACKRRHPDMGGSHEAMVELNTAYAYILNELKHGGAQQREEPKGEQAGRRNEKSWEQTYRDIDEELDEMRRAAEAHEEALRAMRAQAWKSGDRATWARLTWQDLAQFFRGVARGGLKGLTLLFAALVGVGTVLVEANVVSALILLGSGIAFVFSVALKSDKGGILSAALLMFGVMTIWLPPVREALFRYPVATLSVLILLALIFKFAQAGGTVGLMTGGVLALYIISVVLDTSSRQQTVVAVNPPSSRPPDFQPNPSRSPSVRPGSSPPGAPISQPSPAPTPPEPRTLLASQGAILKFVFGVPYRLKVRNGFSTSLRATHGTVALASTDGAVGECRGALDFPVAEGAGPWREIDETIRACNSDALMTVSAAR